MSISPHINIATASIADVFAHLLEVKGHNGLNPNKQGKYSNAVFPHALCTGGTNVHRSRCPECIAVRKYRLDSGETNENQEQRWNVINEPSGRKIKIGDQA